MEIRRGRLFDRPQRGPFFARPPIEPRNSRPSFEGAGRTSTLSFKRYFGPGRQVLYCDTTELPQLLEEGRILRATNPPKSGGIRGDNYFVSIEVFSSPADNIDARIFYSQDVFRYSAEKALEDACSFMRESKVSHEELGRQLEAFERIKEKVLKIPREKKLLESHEKKLRHLSFILQEVAYADCDIITLAAALVHNVRNEGPLREAVQNRKGKVGKIEEEIIETVRNFREIEDLSFDDENRSRGWIMPAIYRIVGKAKYFDRSLLLYFIHRLSYIQMQYGEQREIDSTFVEGVLASLADWIGWKYVGSHLRSKVFLFKNVELYRSIEEQILHKIGMSRHQGENEIRKLINNFSRSAGQNILAEGGVKTAASCEKKMLSRPDDYPSVASIKDLLRVAFRFPEAISFEEARRHVGLTLSQMNGRIIDGPQTGSQKRVSVSGEEATVHHFEVEINHPNPITVEIQVMGAADHEILETSDRSHWFRDLKLRYPNEIKDPAVSDFQSLERLVYDCSVRMRRRTEEERVKILYDELYRRQKVG